MWSSGVSVKTSSSSGFTKNIMRSPSQAQYPSNRTNSLYHNNHSNGHIGLNGYEANGKGFLGGNKQWKQRPASWAAAPPQYQYQGVINAYDGYPHQLQHANVNRGGNLDVVSRRMLIITLGGVINKLRGVEITR